MAKQLNISFKENDTELELYDWIKAKLNPGSYIKELLYNDYLAEKNGIPIQKTFVTHTNKNTENESTKVETDEFGFN